MRQVQATSTCFEAFMGYINHIIKIAARCEMINNTMCNKRKELTHEQPQRVTERVQSKKVICRADILTENRDLNQKVPQESHTKGKY